MLKYLKSLHQLKIPANYSDCILVSGNQSADMDSCCSALLTAYLESSINANSSAASANSPVFTIPLIDIPRKDLRLRKDIEFVFKNLGIDSEWLLFTDDIPATESNTSLFLVDHNSPTIKGTVKKVIDHHAIEDPDADLESCDPHKVVQCGSCMSAVVNYYANGIHSQKVLELFRNDDVLAPLALAPILQDTNNFTRKVEDEDREALKYLSQFHFNLFSPAQNFAAMCNEKSNIDGLSPEDLLRKDYKEWGTIGISSLPKLFKKLLGNPNPEGLAQAMKSHAEKAHLEVMAVSGSGSVKKQHVRELAYYGPQDFDIAAQCPDLELKLRAEVDGVKFYDQINDAATRKQIAPQLRSAFDKYK